MRLQIPPPAIRRKDVYAPAGNHHHLEWRGTGARGSFVISEFCDWLAATRISELFQDLTWFVPTVQTVHILCIAVVMTSISMLDFKLLGISGRGQPLVAMLSYFMPWIWTALLILLITGTLLAITEPARELLNLAFRAKMLMVVAMAGMLRIVQLRVRGDPDYWVRSQRRRTAARAFGATSLLLAVGIVVAGRWIAYI
jgi:uncharacterized membrane protein